MGIDDHFELHDELQERVLALTYHSIVADTASFAGIDLGTARDRKPQRFATRIEVERARMQIRSECDAAGAPDALAEFFSTRWLKQFEPMAM